MATEQDLKDPKKREELDAKAREGETVVPSGTGGMSLEAQIHLAEGRRKGGLSTVDKSGEERVREEGVSINPLQDKSKD